MASLPLITPSDCAVVLANYQVGLALAAGSADRQGIRSAALALAKTAVAFSVPVVVSTSATKVYSGPLIPPLRAVLTDVVPIERRSMTREWFGNWTGTESDFKLRDSRISS